MVLCDSGTPLATPAVVRKRTTTLQCAPNRRPPLTGAEGPYMVSNTDKILTEMFARLLNIKVSPGVVRKLTYVVDGVIGKVQGNLELDTVQGQNTFRALICSMVVHGWGLGMHPDNNPPQNQDGRDLEVQVCKDILVPVSSLQSLRYIKKDKYGRVKKALFEPDQNARIRSHIDSILGEISRGKWGDGGGPDSGDDDGIEPGEDS
jgi:hypothetical protein